jgi:hypothetical protein
MKRYKLPGIDQIQAEMIQAGGNTLHSEIHKLINSIHNKDELPQQWKESIIVHIYKDGNKLTVIMQYSFLKANAIHIDKITEDHQCGYQCNRSTNDQIFCMSDTGENMGVMGQFISYL